MTNQGIIGQPFDFSFEDRDSFVWIIAIALSLAVHFALFLQKQLNAAPSSVNQETVTHVSFSTIVPPPIEVVEPVVETPEPEPVVPPEPEIIPEKPKPEPVKKVKPKPAKKPIIKPKEKPKPVVKEKKQIVKKKTTAPKPPSQENKPVKASPIVAQADPRLIEQTRLTYHALLMRHIDVHKNYPRVARKRKIQGDILVTFTLLAYGTIKNLKAIGKRSILKKATLDAIKHALPMPNPPKELSLPMDVKFKMNYFLK